MAQAFEISQGTSSAQAGPAGVAQSGHLDGLDMYQQSPFFAPSRFGDRWKISVAPDIARVGLFHAASLISALQYWQDKRQAHLDINLVLATGKTQLMGIAEAGRLAKSWSSLTGDERSLLQSFGVDTSRPQAFDPKRIKVFHLDSILPQRREALHSYARTVSRFADLLEVPAEKRFLFYGDVALPPQAHDATYGNTWLNPALKEMSDATFNQLVESVQSDGLLVREYKSGRLSDTHPQYKFLADTEAYGTAY